MLQDITLKEFTSLLEKEQMEALAEYGEIIGLRFDGGYTDINICFTRSVISMQKLNTLRKITRSWDCLLFYPLIYSSLTYKLLTYQIFSENY